MTETPDPGLTDLIAAHYRTITTAVIYRDDKSDGAHRKGFECVCACGDEYMASTRAGDRTEATVLRRADSAHVALVAEQHTNGRITELEAELEKQKRGGRTLGKVIDRTLKWVIEASNSEDLIGDDGDGDWEIVWDRLFQLRPNLEAAIDRAEKAEATITRVRGEVSVYSEIIPTVALADLRAALEGEQQ